MSDQATLDQASSGADCCAVRSHVARLIERLNEKDSVISNLVVEWSNRNAAIKGQCFIKSLEEALAIIDFKGKIPPETSSETNKNGPLFLRLSEELRRHWSFNASQQHTHSWNDREEFITNRLPELLEDKYCHSTDGEARR